MLCAYKMNYLLVPIAILSSVIQTAVDVNLLLILDIKNKKIMRKMMNFV